jgi:hypothetical protein
LRFDDTLLGEIGLYSPRDTKLALELLLTRGLPSEVDATLPFVLLQVLEAAEFDLEISFGAVVSTEALRRSGDVFLVGASKLNLLQEGLDVWLAEFGLLHEIGEACSDMVPSDPQDLLLKPTLEGSRTFGCGSDGKFGSEIKLLVEVGLPCEASQ